jgi:hypothetical protein
MDMLDARDGGDYSTPLLFPKLRHREEAATQADIREAVSRFHSYRRMYAVQHAA